MVADVTNGLGKKRNEYQKKYKKEFNEDRRKKYLCRQMTSHKIRMGYIKKGVCSICGVKETQAHHPDYNNDENITWLCKRHHLELHYNPPLIG